MAVHGKSNCSRLQYTSQPRAPHQVTAYATSIGKVVTVTILSFNRPQLEPCHVVTHAASPQATSRHEHQVPTNIKSPHANCKVQTSRSSSQVKPSRHLRLVSPLRVATAASSTCHLRQVAACVRQVSAVPTSNLKLQPHTANLTQPTSNFKPHTSNLKPQTSNFTLQTSNLTLQTSHCKPQTSNLKPQTSNLDLKLQSSKLKCKLQSSMHSSNLKCALQTSNALSKLQRPR